jgi:hypothetical protein
MTTRRRFIQSGIGAGALAAIAPAMGVSRAASAALAALPPQRVIYDERFSNARAFGDESQRLGLRTLAMSGNVHDLWYHDVSQLWRQTQATIAGMTDFRALFLLEMMASDVRLRVVHRIHHIEQPEADTSHHIYGPLTARAQWQGQLVGSGASWPRQSAAICARWRNEHNSTSSIHSDIAAARDQGIDRTTLVSWVIAARTA